MPVKFKLKEQDTPTLGSGSMSLALAKADGVFHETEQNYIKGLGAMFNIKDDVVKLLMAL